MRNQRAAYFEDVLPLWGYCRKRAIWLRKNHPEVLQELVNQGQGKTMTYFLQFQSDCSEAEYHYMEKMKELRKDEMPDRQTQSVQWGMWMQALQIEARNYVDHEMVCKL